MQNLFSVEDYLINVEIDWDTIRLTLPNKEIVTFEATKQFEWEQFMDYLGKSKEFNEQYQYEWKFHALAFSIPTDLRMEYEDVPQGEIINEKFRIKFGDWGLEYLRKFASKELARFHWNRLHFKEEDEEVEL